MTRTRNAAPILLALSVVAGISGESILGLINETVTFQLKVDEIPKGITWKFNEDKVCEIDSTGDVCFSYYKGRANINKTNGFLTISNLVNSDAGKYTAEIHQPTVKEFIFQLEVLGKVTRPKITCNGSVYQATLSCETSGDSYTTLKWDQDGQSVPASNGPITLTIEKRRGSHYTCISNNTVSEARNIFAPDECFLKDDRSRIGLFLAVIFMILIPATAYGVFKAFSKKRNEQTPEAEKLMKDSKEPHSEEPGPPMTNCPSDLSSNHGIMSEMAFEEPARSFHNNEPKDKETAPEDPSYVTAGNETTREKPSSTTADKEAAPEEQSNITADEKKDPGNPFDTTEGNETPQEKPSSTTADKEAAPEEQSNITADEKKDPGNPFDTTEGNETPQEKPSSTTADKEAAPEEQSNITADEKKDPGNPFDTTEGNETPQEKPSSTTADKEAAPEEQSNITADKEAAPEEQSNITEDEKKDPGNPFDTTAGNETPQEKPSSTTADKEAAPEEQSNITADEKKDPGNPFDTTEGKETPREKPSSTTADKEAAPEEQSNITADEKKDPGNPFDTTEGNETPQEKPSSTTAD
ncbi:protein starmaker-like isoform X27 [Erpetoichthys calabaricus]|uniref:protein starmaker-like isoform X26 n=1 Tax=Erpetoichthys calabaricus TaxID=27687 RepID=UPI0022348320|nr:protein starmaker-like isoform X26 [Erpetoichthys calabaricus]XP_051781667.1 protein starmaker-like isoform X27 [Erpetoichthys calabaricus]